MAAMVWFRNDLRLRDNPALFKAAELGEGVLGVYIHCDAYVDRFPLGGARLDFIRRHLLILTKDLARLNIPLRVFRVAKVEDIPVLLRELASTYQVSHLFFNAEYPLDELHRDKAVNRLLTDAAVKVKRCHDRVVIPPGLIRNGQGGAYKVYTAFKRKWLTMAASLSMRPLGLPAKQADFLGTKPAAIGEIYQLFDGLSLRDFDHIWPAGEDEAYARLDSFIENRISDYQKYRDFPAIQGTSSLSPYFTIGALSPRQALHAVLHFTQGEWSSANAGVDCWVNEIIWREFYQHVVVDFPQVCQHKAMQRHTEAFPWHQAEAEFKTWCEGNTGIPIVDAAMRQLNVTGWMHNRLRMVVAMFLTKNLQIDWRLGERYFMQQLIDADFAANNGGWQWSASTGTDAAPYFRIFNPVSQSQKFDPNGEFIRTWVPELRELNAKQIHQPPALEYYPRAMVDLGESRKQTIELFAQLGRQ